MSIQVLLTIIGSLNVGGIIAIVKMFMAIGAYKQQVEKHEKKLVKVEERTECIDVLKNRLDNVEKRDVDIKEIFLTLDKLREDMATIKTTLSMMNSSEWKKKND